MMTRSDTAPHNTRPGRDILRAALWMLGAIASFLSMAVAGRAVSFQLDTFEIMSYRSLVGVAIMLALISLRGLWAQIDTRHFGLHVVRNLGHFTGQNLWFYAITMIPLAQVFALEFSSPLWVLVMSPLVLGERLTVNRVAVALLGFCGILMVARPFSVEIGPGVLAACGAALGFAFSIVTTKRLTRDVSTVCILFWLTTMQAVFGLVCGWLDGDFALPDASTLPLLVVIGCAGLMAHFCLTTALTLAPATVIMPIDFARLPLAAILGVLLYAEPLNIWTFVGAVVIFGSNYLNILAERRRNAAPS